MESLGRFPRVLNVLPREKIEGPPRDFLKANPRPHPRPDQRPKTRWAEYIQYSRDLPRAPFTMIPPRLSHRFSFFLPNALLYYVKREKQTNKLFSNGTLGSSVVNVNSSRYKH